LQFRAKIGNTSSEKETTGVFKSTPRLLGHSALHSSPGELGSSLEQLQAIPKSSIEVSATPGLKILTIE